jgi:uncharacterized protein (TIGR03435 family)
MPLILVALAAFGQSASTPPAFEVAAVKLNTSGAPGPQKERFLPGGRLEIGNATVKELIGPLYGIKRDMIVGGPKWLDTDRFDIIAKASQDTPVPALLLMAKTLLEERFKLVYHHEDKVMPVYALVAGKGGAKLHESVGGGRQSCNSRPETAKGDPVIHRECHNVTMAEFVRQLGLGGYGLDDRPVVNLTQLPGTYDFEFAYSRPRPVAPGEPADLPSPSIFEAVAHLGLKLEAGRQKVPVMVIDSAERPVE